MEQIMLWLNETFYREVTITETHNGYKSERSYSGNNYVTVELPFEETITTTKEVLDVQACAAFVIIVLTFVTVVTFLKKVVLGR